MEQLLCHLYGDYVLQNQWMANNKVKAWLPALVHASVYMLAFLLLKPSLLAFCIMWSTHLLIDRFRLARYWTEFYGIGNTGTLWMVLKHDRAPWEPGYDELPEKERVPDWLAVWLLILIDNTLHLTINFLCLKYL